LSSIRRIIYGAAPIPQEMIEGALATFGDVLYQNYGQSEIVPLTVLTPRDHRENRDGPRLRSAGRPAPNCFVRIEDDAGNILPTGEFGEIVGIGPGVMQGIYRDSAATAERFTRDGWVRTNDMGRLDEGGYLFVTDRKDDMIISGGFNIAPAEIEDALARHPDVVESVVFGMPHAEWGATPVAVVRLRDAATASEAELIMWCQTQIGSVKKPTRVILTSEPLPISGAGKLLRRSAKAQYGAGI
jgi:acyl-CoA synthetase (AMP-forming)/AMP-acid ligase II